MRILHVGWGFMPWRRGGLIAYAHDLMAAQLERGHEVGYFFSGRHYPYVSGPRLKRWRRDGVTMHELVNAPIPVGLERGTRYPELDLAEPRSEAAFRRVLDEARPDVIHIQELLGLPSSLIQIAADAGIPMLMTLQDYQPLCSTLRLFDANEQVCLRRDVGVDCVTCNAAAPRDSSALIEMTLRYEHARLQSKLTPLDAWFVGPVIKRVSRHATRPQRARVPPLDNKRLAEAFQRRREVNVERLGRVDCLIAQSPRVGEIYRTLGVPAERMTDLPFTLEHIERLRVRSFDRPPERVMFASLNSGSHPSKGSMTIIAALRQLRAAGLEGRFGLRWLGWVNPDLRPELDSYEGVELTGDYGTDELDDLLGDVDVGLVPSIWEEAFAYAGLELVAKGIPIIANPIGGIVEYARAGQTAWLNESRGADELARLMQQLIVEPQQIVDMHQRLMTVRDELVTPIASHIEAIDEICGDLAAGRTPAPRLRSRSAVAA